MGADYDVRFYSQRRPRPDVDAANRQYSSTEEAILLVTTLSINPGKEIRDEDLLVRQHTLHYAR